MPELQTAAEKVYSGAGWSSTTCSSIPPITDPMGKHWEQPSAFEIELDETHALMTRETLGKLKDYSCSQPSGVYPGKMWRRRVDYYDESKGWILCWYGFSDKGADFCSNNYRRVLLANSGLSSPETP